MENVAAPLPSVVRFCRRRADQMWPSNRYTAVLAMGVPLKWTPLICRGHNSQSLVSVSRRGHGRPARAHRSLHGGSCRKDCGRVHEGQPSQAVGDATPHLICQLNSWKDKQLSALGPNGSRLLKDGWVLADVCVGSH